VQTGLVGGQNMLWATDYSNTGPECTPSFDGDDGTWATWVVQNFASGDTSTWSSYLILPGVITPESPDPTNYESPVSTLLFDPAVALGTTNSIGSAISYDTGQPNVVTWGPTSSTPPRSSPSTHQPTTPSTASRGEAISEQNTLGCPRTPGGLWVGAGRMSQQTMGGRSVRGGLTSRGPGPVRWRRAWASDVPRCRIGSRGGASPIGACYGDLTRSMGRVGLSSTSMPRSAHPRRWTRNRRGGTTIGPPAVRFGPGCGSTSPRHGSTHVSAGSTATSRGARRRSARADRDPSGFGCQSSRSRGALGARLGRFRAGSVPATPRSTDRRSPAVARGGRLPRTGAGHFCQPAEIALRAAHHVARAGQGVHRRTSRPGGFCLRPRRPRTWRR
jgi:hypothetical protein